MIIAGFEGTDHCEKKNQVLTAKWCDTMRPNQWHVPEWM